MDVSEQKFVQILLFVAIFFKTVLSIKMTSRLTELFRFHLLFVNSILNAQTNVIHGDNYHETTIIISKGKN